MQRTLVVQSPGYRWRIFFAGFACLLAMWALPSSASAKAFEARVPLKDGKVHLQTLAGALSSGLGEQPVATPPGDLDVSGDKGDTFVAALNQALGDGCRVKVK